MGKKSKRRRKKRRARGNHKCENKHHLLWIRKKWHKKPYAHKLRNHSYCTVFIPALTVHKDIHETIREVPVPDEDDCRVAVRCLEKMMVEGIISDYDPPAYRIDILTNILKNSPDTVNALLQQRELFL